MVVEIVDATIENNSLKRALSGATPPLSQEETAHRLGISYRHFNRIVLGKAEPSLLLAKKMEAVIGKPVDELFKIKVRTRKVARV